MTKLTRRQRLFIEAMNHGAPNATQAARQAGYSPRGIQYAASRLMHHPKIRALLRPTTKELLADPRRGFKVATRLLEMAEGISPRLPRHHKVTEVEHHGNAIEELRRLQRELLGFDPGRLPPTP